MATLYKTVIKTGGGDYTDFVTAVSDILVSGLAATGYYDQYVLAVDSGLYSGYFSANVPYSGQLNIVGDSTWFIPTGTSTISGVVFGNVNVKISNFSIQCSSCANTIFNIYSGSALSLVDTDFLSTTNGIINSGTLYLDNISAHGVNPLSGYFIKDYGSSLIYNTRVSYFMSGIYSQDLSLSNSTIRDNSTSVIGYGGVVSISNSVIYGTGTGIKFECTPTGELYINSSDIISTTPVQVSGILLYIGDSILYGSGYCISGVVQSGSIHDSCLYPSGTLISITQTNISNLNPQFNDSSNGDFRLVFKQTTGSPCIEFKNQNIFSSPVELYTEQAQFNIKDKRGTPATNTFTDFIYKQGNTLLLSDYQKELKFANIISEFSDLTHSVEMMANFEVSGVSTKGAFNKNSSPFPYDWDYKIFNTPEITNRHNYLIPRSVVDITNTISGFVGDWLPRVAFNKIDKRSITPYLFADYRGVAFDYDLSIPGQAVVWMIEGNNQTLIQLNAFTGERLAEYPLFVPDISGKFMSRPSGIIGIGVKGNQYKFVLESDPNVEILADNEGGRLNWILTDLDTHKDARGVLASKNNLFISVTDYNPQSIYDRSTTPIYSGAIGRLVRYDNNNTFEHFIANYTTQVGPSTFILSSGNCYPTDLTIYEDGTLLVADWVQSNQLFRYKLAYDYALVQSTYDTETRILLREYYDNVEL